MVFVDEINYLKIFGLQTEELFCTCLCCCRYRISPFQSGLAVERLLTCLSPASHQIQAQERCNQQLLPFSKKESEREASHIFCAPDGRYANVQC